MKNIIYERRVVFGVGSSILLTLTEEVNGFALFEESFNAPPGEEDPEPRLSVRWFGQYDRANSIEEAVQRYLFLCEMEREGVPEGVS